MALNPEITVLREIYKAGYNYFQYSKRIYSNNALVTKSKLDPSSVSHSLAYLSDMHLIIVSKDKSIRLTPEGFRIAREGIKHKQDGIPTILALYISMMLVVSETANFLLAYFVNKNLVTFLPLVLWGFIGLMAYVVYSLVRQVMLWSEPPA